MFTDYTPLSAHGTAAQHAIAIDRGGAIAVATRLPLTLHTNGGWDDTVLATGGGRRVDAITGRHFDGGELALGEMLATYPVALLLATGGA